MTNNNKIREYWSELWRKHPSGDPKGYWYIAGYLGFLSGWGHAPTAGAIWDNQEASYILGYEDAKGDWS